MYLWTWLIDWSFRAITDNIAKETITVKTFYWQNLAILERNQINFFNKSFFFFFAFVLTHINRKRAPGPVVKLYLNALYKAEDIHLNIKKLLGPIYWFRSRTLEGPVKKA